MPAKLEKMLSNPNLECRPLDQFDERFEEVMEMSKEVYNLKKEDLYSLIGVHDLLMDLYDGKPSKHDPRIGT